MRRLATSLIVFCLVVCGSTTAQADDSKHDFRVGLVTTTGGLSNPFNRLPVAGLAMAQDRLHVETKVVMPSSQDEYIPDLTAFAAENYDLVIGLYFEMASAVDTVAAEFPNVHFVLLDADSTQPNVEMVSFKEQESGALAGAIAGMLEASSLAPRSQNIISVIGVRFGTFVVPPVAHYMAGYRWGAQLVDPSVTVLIDFSNSFTGDGCGTLANNEIASGADIIFPVAGGCSLSALQAAGRAGVYSVGVDVSQKDADPSVIISAVKRFDMATFDVIRAAVKDGFQSGTVTLGLNDDATGYTVDNFPGGDLPPEVRNAAKKVQQGIETGHLVPPTSL